jgi:hypothetical protein
VRQVCNEGHADYQKELQDRAGHGIKLDATDEGLRTHPIPTVAFTKPYGMKNAASVTGDSGYEDQV